MCYYSDMADFIIWIVLFVLTLLIWHVYSRYVLIPKIDRACNEKEGGKVVITKIVFVKDNGDGTYTVVPEQSVRRVVGTRSVK